LPILLHTKESCFLTIVTTTKIQNGNALEIQKQK